MSPSRLMNRPIPSCCLAIMVIIMVSMMLNPEEHFLCRSVGGIMMIVSVPMP